MSTARRGSWDLQGFSAPAGLGRGIPTVFPPSRPFPPTWRVRIGRSCRENDSEVGQTEIRCSLGVSDFPLYRGQTPLLIPAHGDGRFAPFPPWFTLAMGHVDAVRLQRLDGHALRPRRAQPPRCPKRSERGVFVSWAGVCQLRPLFAHRPGRAQSIAIRGRSSRCRGNRGRCSA